MRSDFSKLLVLHLSASLVLSMGVPNGGVPYCRIARGKAGRQKHILSHLTKQTLMGRWEEAVTNVTHTEEMFLVRK